MFRVSKENEKNMKFQAVQRLRKKFELSRPMHWPYFALIKKRPIFFFIQEKKESDKK